MATDASESEEELEAQYNFVDRIKHETTIFRDCDLVIATTPVQTDELINDYSMGKGRVRMIPPGYDDNRFFPVS